MNKIPVRAIGLRSALSAKLDDGLLRIVDSLDVEVNASRFSFY